MTKRQGKGKSGVIWTTKDGKKIDLADMTNSHLSNTIKFVERKIKTYPGYQVYAGHGEHAEEAVEQENIIAEERYDAFCYILDELKGEQKKRRESNSEA